MSFAHHILVPTDFSDASRTASEAAARLAAQFDARVTLLHVDDPRTPTSSRLRASDGDEAAIDEALRERLEAIRRGPLAHVKDVSLVVASASSAAHAICEQAVKVGADLIVIATHGRTGLKKLLIGSVTERVVQQATVPVLTLPAQGDE